jgi:hypothetical protein
MPAFNSANLITVTIDGVVYSVPRGTYSLAELQAFVKQQSQTGAAPKYAALTINTAVATQPSSVGPNGSYTLYDSGVVITSTAGS